MKSKILLCVCGIYLGVVSATMAAAIGDSITPLGDMKIAVSVEDNIIFDKDIEKTGTLSSFEYDSVNQIYGKFSLGVTDAVNFYTKLGVSDSGKLKQKYTDGSTTDIECEYGFLWGLGASWVYLMRDALSLGIDLQYNAWEGDVDKVTESGQSTSNLSGGVKSAEFQIAAFISQKIELTLQDMNFTPYAGAVYNHFKTKTDDKVKYQTSSTAYELSWSLKGDDSFGILVGTDIGFKNVLLLNIEGRFIDETAVTAAAGWKF